MSLVQGIIGVLFLIPAYFLVKYCDNTRQKKGPIYSLFYLNISEEEREKVDINKEYMSVTIIYGLIALFFIFVALLIFTFKKIFAFLAFICLVADVVYFFIDFSRKA